nr:CSC1-like protein At3g54510 [Ipomoea batatas]
MLPHLLPGMFLYFTERIQQLRNKRQYPNQFTVLVRRIPFFQEHKVRGCSIDHFFTKHHPYSYQSYQILYDGKELENLVVTMGAVIAAKSQQHSNPLLWITEMAPEPRDVLWRNLAIPYRILPLYEIVILVAVVFLTLFFAIPVTAVQGIAQYERLSKWFPPIKGSGVNSRLKSVVTGYLPSAILNGFIYIIPFAMIGLSRLAAISREIGQSFSQPKYIPSRLASAVSAQADFFMTYILTNGLSGFSLEILQPGLLIWDAIKPSTWDRGKERKTISLFLPYYRIIPLLLSVHLLALYMQSSHRCFFHFWSATFFLAMLSSPTR